MSTKSNYNPGYNGFFFNTTDIKQRIQNSIQLHKNDVIRTKGKIIITPFATKTPPKRRPGK